MSSVRIIASNSCSTGGCSEFGSTKGGIELELPWTFSGSEIMFCCWTGYSINRLFWDKENGTMRSLPVPSRASTQTVFLWSYECTGNGTSKLSGFSRYTRTRSPSFRMKCWDLDWRSRNAADSLLSSLIANISSRAVFIALKLSFWVLGVVLWVFAGVHKKHQTHNHKRPSRGSKCLGNLCREKGVAW